jgi:hypothetical protein
LGSSLLLSYGIFTYLLVTRFAAKGPDPFLSAILPRLDFCGGERRLYLVVVAFSMLFIVPPQVWWLDSNGQSAIHAIRHAKAAVVMAQKPVFIRRFEGRSRPR